MITGLLLINLGTPDSPHIRDVRRFLRIFLADKRVITLPSVLRFLLVHLLIVPLRSRKTQQAYQSIWLTEGSPLRVHSEALCTNLQQKLGSGYRVALGMRYGNPSLEKALEQLKSCEKIIVLPLYPQYASAATGSSIEAILRLLAPQTVLPHLRVIRDFYADPGFIHAQADAIKPYLATHDMLLFSYHGLPEQQIRQAGCAEICEGPCTTVTKNIHCYRAQCFATTAEIARTLALRPEQYTTAFQSRLGKTPWIKPYSDKMLSDFAARGIKRLAVVCPSFVADCLETLEEIGIRAQEDWQKLGGECLSLIPCMNASQAWCDAVIDWIKK